MTAIWDETATRCLLHDLANDPVVVAGQEAKWFVRAAMTPGLTEAGLAEMVWHITVGGYRGHPINMASTAETRARVAAAAIRGYIEREDVAAGPLVWHRWMGGVGVEVAA